MIVNVLSEKCSQIEEMIASHDPRVNEKLSGFATFINNNLHGLRNDILKDKNCISVLQKIGQIKATDSKAIPIIKRIHHSCALVELKVLLKEGDLTKLTAWVLKNRDGISSDQPADLFEDLSEAREQLTRANRLTPEIEGILSSLMTHGRSSSGSLNSFSVYPADLEKNPKKVLLELGNIILQTESMPNIVYMDPRTEKPTPGVDAGGLKRQLVATLCENLFKPSSKFPFVKEGDYDVPIVNTPDDIEALRTFARLLGMAAKSPMPTGTNLAPSFFYSLFSLDDSELDAISSDQPIPEPAKKKLHMARLGMPEESFDEADVDELVNESNLLTATAIVAKELQTLLGPQFRKFGEDVEKFMTKVQGLPATEGNFMQIIRCTDENYKNWINNFIKSFPYTVTKRGVQETYELKHFAMLLTGSYSLNEDTFAFEVHPERKFFESETRISTCAKNMELPGDMTEDDLKSELKAQLSLMKSFNAA